MAKVSESGGPIPDRSDWTVGTTIAYIWSTLGLPEEALKPNALEEEEPCKTYYASSYKISHLAQSTLALSALGAALIRSIRNGTGVPKVTVPLRQACL